jgi:hypothetical protein
VVPSQRQEHSGEGCLVPAGWAARVGCCCCSYPGADVVGEAQAVPIKLRQRMGGGQTGNQVEIGGRRQRRAAVRAPHPQSRQSEAWPAKGAGSQRQASPSVTCMYVGSTFITVKPLSRLIAKACQAPRSPRLHRLVGSVEAAWSTAGFHPPRCKRQPGGSINFPLQLLAQIKPYGG